MGYFLGDTDALRAEAARNKILGVPGGTFQAVGGQDGIMLLKSDVLGQWSVRVPGVFFSRYGKGEPVEGMHMFEDADLEKVVWKARSFSSKAAGMVKKCCASYGNLYAGMFSFRDVFLGDCSGFGFESGGSLLAWFAVTGEKSLAPESLVEYQDCYGFGYSIGGKSFVNYFTKDGFRLMRR